MSALEIGEIKIEPQLPEVFKDEGVRTLAKGSLEDFRGRNGGELPMKYRIEEFCFQRPEQICTVDSEKKYIAWDGGNSELTTSILQGITPTDTSLVLRSHPIEFGLQTPTISVDYESIQAYLSDARTDSIVEKMFFSKIDPERTVIQLIKNPYPKTGIFLCRSTFVYDEELRDELQVHQATEPQYRAGEYFSLDGVPESFLGFRIKPLLHETREKKRVMGTLVLYNPATGKFELRDGLPSHGLEYYQYGRYGKSERTPRKPLGRTLDVQEGGNTTTLHYDNPQSQHIVDDTSYYDQATWFTDPDLDFIQQVLTWQLPRIFKFEDEIRQQEWIPQGESNTHQFVIFPLQELSAPAINTQYYDFRPHISREEMRSLAEKSGKDFDTMGSEEKFRFFF